MSIPQIIVWAVLAALALVIGFFAVSWHISNKQADKFDVVATVGAWQKAKIPFIGRAVLVYTRKGKPMQVGSNLMLKSRQPKLGTKGMWTVYTYRTPGKATAYIARRKRK